MYRGVAWDGSINTPSYRASASPQTYGDLELFLLGLQLRELIGVFKAHNMSFADLLSLTDQDLEKVSGQHGSHSHLSITSDVIYRCH